MSYIYRRRYTGPLQLAVFDWAGTLIDFGSLAPLAAFLKVFEAEQISVSLAEARAPMGIEKRTHIATMLAEPGLAARWQATKGAPVEESDIDRLFANFVPAQLEAIAEHAELIPGVLDCVAALRARGIKVGSTSGYNGDMMAAVLPQAERQGLRPDHVVCSSDVPKGRPSPAMALANAAALSVDCVAACVKIDDTVAGIEEGLNAGFWTVGLAVSGNETGLSEADWQALSLADQEAYRQGATRRLLGAGAHYVIDSSAELLPIVDSIERRLAVGETP
ncbi:MAG: phosphonoacetaldehyde hydrolase [Rhodospirillales bacterium]